MMVIRLRIRSSSAAPKPNTRFLRHIIRETDNHNAALKRKEEREARDRARLRHRTSGDGNRDRNPAREKERDDRDRHRSHRRHHRSRSESEEDRSRRHRRHDRSSKRDRRRDRDERGHRTYSHSRSRSPRERAHDSRRRPRTPESRRYEKDPSPAPSGNDSDPLEDLVGPLPRKDGHEPIRTRGRGAYKPSSSTIDAHFAKDYDPTLDVHPDEDEVQLGGRSGRRRVQGLMTEDDDWELALEALRDRTRWKQKGEERLRQAGFDESTLERWRGNAAFGGGAGEEGRVEDVKWSRRGEGREWDRGKVFDDEGGVNVKAPW